MKFLKRISILFLLTLSIWLGQVNAQTIVSGPINQNTTWTEANSPYVVTGQVTVSSGVTLTVSAGVVVKFSANTGLTVVGTLNADGTPSQPIVFTSLKDDSVGGDTNADGSATNPAKGDWEDFHFTSSSSNNVLGHVVIRYGGGVTSRSLMIETSSLALSNSTVEESWYHGIYVSGASPAITGSVVRNNGRYGIYLVSSNATITNNTISGNASYGIYANGSMATITGNTISGNSNYTMYLDVASSGSTLNGNVISGNKYNGIAVGGGTINVSATWGSVNAPYVVTSSITVSSGVTLTVSAGVVVKFSANTGLTVSGTLNADGTPSQPIVFTSFKDDSVGGDTNADGSATSPAKGDWEDLHFTSTSTNNVLDHAVIRYGGGVTSRSVMIETSSLTLSNSTVEQSWYYGIYVSGASPAITGSVVRNNGRYGIYLVSSNATITNNTISGNASYGIYANGSMATITGNTVSGNSDYAVYLDAPSSRSTLSGNVISNNGGNGVFVSGGTLSASAVWGQLGAAYVVGNGDVTISSGVTLTVSAGVVVKLSGVRLRIEGTLIADGTSSQPIVFTSLKDDSVGGDTNGDGAATSPARGDWHDLQFISTSSNNVLGHVVIRYGGGVTSQSISISTSSLTLSNSTVEESWYYGIYVSGASPAITGSVIRNNGNRGIYLISSNATITNNTISGNASYGVYNLISTMIVNVKNNYWGDPSGPYDPSDDRATGGWYNPAGKGDRVSDYVDYTPWLGYDPNIKLSGTVYDDSNKTRISGATVNLGSYSTTTNSQGYYVFEKISGGNYTATVSKAGYFSYSTSLNITSATTKDFYLIPGSGTCTDGNLSGYVRSAVTNAGLGNVTVNLSNGFSTLTNSSGYYSFPIIATGSYTISAIASNYSSYNQIINICGNTVSDVLLTKPETVYGPKTNSGYGPDPVNTATGNYVFQRKDLSIPGRGLNFVFERNYNSQDASAVDAVEAPIGYGWTHSYNVSLKVDPADFTVKIRWGDGKIETWTPNGSGGFTPQYGVFDTMIDNGDGTYTLEKKDLTQYNFSTSGQLSSVVDKNSNAVTFTYTGSDLTQITDTVGRNVNLTYDGNNRITQITDPTGRTVQFAYDVNGNLVSSTDMNGKATNFTYDANHQLLTVVDPRGNTVVTNTYDSQKRVVTSQRDAKGGQTQYIYDEINSKTNIIDALGYTTTHFFDKFLRLTQETDSRGYSAYYTYDSAGNRKEVKDKNGNTTKYTYDTRGNVVTKKDALDKVTTITYDDNNNPLSRADALGNTTTFEYDAKGNLTKTTDPLSNITTVAYDTHGQPLTITDPRAKTTTNVYDAEGNLSEVTDALGNKTTYTYDGVGRKLTIKDALNRITTYTYDNNNNLLTVTDPLAKVTTYTYDANNNKLTITDPRGNTTTYAYDVKNLLTTTIDPLSKTVTNAYDALDRKISITDKRGSTTTYVYDEIGNLVQLITPNSELTTYSYDPNGNKLTETNPLGQTVTYIYDKLNRVTSVLDPLTNSTTTAYDALGRVISTTNAKGQTTTFEYDAMGRLTKVTDANGKNVTYTYDPNGNRLTMTDPNGNTTTYAYDDLNRLIQKVEPLGSTYQYTYDAVGNRKTLIDPNGSTINYAYDANNRLTTITYPDASTTTFTYDENGNRIQMVDKLGTSTYGYDALNRMTSYADPFGKSVGYGYDASGNRTTLTYPGAKVVNYTYDALNRLVRVTDWVPNSTFYYYDSAGNLVSTLNPNSAAVNYSYDAASRLTGLSNTKSDLSVISSYSYTLDPLGNHLQVVQNEPLNPILPPKNITLTYDKENRLTNAGGVTFTYDFNGNMTGKGTDTFAYDFEDRLTQSIIGGVSSQYGYDGVGNRFTRTEGGVTKRYIQDVNRNLTNVLAETDATGTITAYYVYGLGLISKVLPDGTTYNYHYDSRGSTTALTDASQNITDAYAYDSFGKLSNSTGSTMNPFKYVGRYGVMEEGNGLQYIRARYYVPELGRFVKKDLMAGNDRIGQSLNRYVFTLNNPVKLIDISGLSALEGAPQLGKYLSSDLGHEVLVQAKSYTGFDWLLDSMRLITFGGKLWSMADPSLGILKDLNALLTLVNFSNNTVKELGAKNIMEGLKLKNIIDNLANANKDEWIEAGIDASSSSAAVAMNTILSPVNAGLRLIFGGKQLPYIGQSDLTLRGQDIEDLINLELSANKPPLGGGSGGAW